MKALKPFLPGILLLIFIPSFSQIMISDSAGTRDSSAAFEVRSTKGGFLLPRMSTQQRKAIRKPAPGLMVFDTTKQKFYGYLRDSGWRPFMMGFDAITVSEPLTPASVLDNSNGDQLGFSVAINGNVAIASATLDDVSGKTDQGSLYVFRKMNGAWTNTQKLTAPDGAAGDRFGMSVSITGEYAFVSSVFDDIGENVDQGSVYVYKIINEELIYQQKLTGSLGSSGDLFGYFVAADKSQLFIGAPNDDVSPNTDQGSVYFFKLENGNWVEQQKIIQDSAALTNDHFGFGISIDSDRIAIGGHINTDSDYGYGQSAVFIYQKVNGTWQRRQKITQPGNTDKHTAFGYQTTLKENILTVGAWLVDGTSHNRGTVYVFKKNGTSWELVQNLTPGDPYTGDVYGDYIGSSTRQSEQYLVSGSGYEDISSTGVDQGAFYIYEFNGDKWQQLKKITSANPTTLDLFGHRVAIHNGNIIVSAMDANGQKGQVYFYSIND